MKALRFKVLLEWDDDSDEWVTYVPTLNHICSYGKTKEEALEYTQRSVATYLKEAENEGLHIPLRETRTEWAEIEITLP
jgi:predicted RNase H-like HicB family nuclease